MRPPNPEWEHRPPTTQELKHHVLTSMFCAAIADVERSYGRINYFELMAAASEAGHEGEREAA